MIFRILNMFRIVRFLQILNMLRIVGILRILNMLRISRIIVKHCKTGAFLVRILQPKRKNDPGNSGPLDFQKFSILRYVCVLCRFWYIYHFLSFFQKCRCVPKIGFPADISIDSSIDMSIDNFIDILIDIFIDIVIDISIGILIGMSIDISIDIFIDTSLLTFLLTLLF